MSGKLHSRKYQGHTMPHMTAINSIRTHGSWFSYFEDKLDCFLSLDEYFLVALVIDSFGREVVSP